MNDINLQVFKLWAKALKERCDCSECNQCPYFNPEDCFCIIRQITHADTPCDWKV